MLQCYTAIGIFACEVDLAIAYSMTEASLMNFAGRLFMAQARELLLPLNYEC